MSDSPEPPDGPGPRRRRAPPLPVPPRRLDDDREPGVRDSARGGFAPAPATDVDWKKALRERLRLLPRQSGVYVFRDGRGRVLYVGKAKRLHMRVRNYFRRDAAIDVRLQGLRSRIRSLDWVVTASETEALVLETNFIKQYAPPFNVRLKDDKKYPYLAVTLGHRFPRLRVTRTVVDDGSRYFGPYTNVKDLRRTLHVIRSVFRLRNCTDRRLARGGRECLQYFIGRCTAPCTRRVDETAYRSQVEPLVRLLEGKGRDALEQLRARMQESAGELRFEESARLRDGIQTLEELFDRQRMTPSSSGDAEVIGLAVRGDRAAAVLLRVDEGKVIGKRQHMLGGARGREREEILRSLVLALYLSAPDVPRHITAAVLPRGRALLEQLLSERGGRPLAFRVARGETWRSLLQAAEENAHLWLEETELLVAAKRARVAREVYELQELLGLSDPPYRIEGFDISNFQGAHAVASQVVFQDGKPLKSAYRRLSMAAVPGPDDFAMMEEALRRRLARLDRPSETPPDLILVDGGRGQVASAARALSAAGRTLPLVGLAKREEEIVLPGDVPTLRLPRNSGALRLLQRVRDEAHRFAVTYHRGVRARAQEQSALDQIRGVGPARRRALLRAFGSLTGIRSATVEEIAKLPGFGLPLARAISAALIPESEPDARSR